MTEPAVEVRNVRPDELDEVMRVEAEAWPAEIQASRAKFESRMKVFPEGFFGVYIDDRLAGVSTSHVVPYRFGDDFTWEQMSAQGYITNHDPRANSLYVVSVGVSQAPYARRTSLALRAAGQLGMGSRLVEAQKRLAERRNLDQLILSARLPGFHREPPGTPVETYLARRDARGQRLDPELRFYERLGLRLVKPKFKAMESDPESRDWGALMCWRRPSAP